MYEYMTKGYFAQVPGLMEEYCKEELKELGATDVETTYRGVYFKSDLATLYKINYNSRLLSRVLAPIKSFHCNNTNVLIKNAKQIRWEDFCSVEKTFAISSSVAESNITNSLYASQNQYEKV